MKAIEIHMSKAQHHLLKVTLLMMLIGALTACGSSKTGGEGFGEQNSSSTSPAPSPTPNDKATAECSKDVGASPDLQVRLMQYKDLQGQTRSDVVRLQFKQAPIGWQNGNWDLRIYRWTASPDNSTSIDSTPLTFQFEKRAAAGFQLLTTNAYPIFNWTEIQQMGEFAKISAASPQDFFNSASLLVNLRDSTNSYQVLRVVLRQGSVIMAQTDVLVPAFAADPSVYNADPRHPAVLQNMHPLKDKLGQNWTQANFYEFARAFCF